MRVFVSHSQKDEAAASLIKKGLADHGVEVWPSHSMTFGNSWADGIVTAREQADAVVALLSPNFLQSRHAIVETSNIRSVGKPVLPVILGGHASDYLPLLSESLAVRYDPNAPGLTVEQLLEGLRRLRQHGNEPRVADDNPNAAEELAEAQEEISKLRAALALAEDEAAANQLIGGPTSRASVRIDLPLGLSAALLSAAISVAVVTQDPRYLIIALLAPILLFITFSRDRGRK